METEIAIFRVPDVAATQEHPIEIGLSSRLSKASTYPVHLRTTNDLIRYTINYVDYF